MPIKLNDVDKFGGLKVNRTMVRDMHTEYLTNETAPKLQTAHFTLDEVLQLFIDNGIISDQKFTKAELVALKKNGLKIIIGNHFSGNTCPSNRSIAGHEPTYHGKNTVILTNTKLETKLRAGQDPKSKGTWAYLLNDHKGDGTPTNSISIAGATQIQTNLDGLDRSTICPSDCPNTLDTNDQYHEEV